MNILFVCSMNKWRSPTAETIFRRINGIHVRSAGTSRKARHHVTIKDIRWADIICVMEHKHRSRLHGEFRDELNNKQLHVLDIPDDYTYMDPDLIELLSASLQPIIGID